MARYKITGKILLDFLTINDQVTRIFDNGDGFVEFSDDQSPKYIDNNGNEEWTINWNFVVENYVKEGKLTKIET